MQIKSLFKLLILGGISILLLIALSSIGGMMRDRKYRQQQVQQDIADSYAGEQCLIGPVITLKYDETWTGRFYNKEKNNWYEKDMCETRTARIYPETLTYDGGLDVQERYRGIFKAHVFQSRGTLAGSVQFPDQKTLHFENNSTIELISATASLCISDPRGISQVPEFNWNGAPLDVIPGSALAMQSEGIHAVIPADNTSLKKTFPFSLDLNVHGMAQFKVVPIGSNNRIQIQSSWPHPSFTGDFLATTRNISDDGFTAEWNINGLACSAQHSMDASEIRSIQHLGVRLIDPVNPYPLTDRALKYGFLFIFITFASFFLFELVRQLRIHPIQYSFVGLAQAVFFLLLLSLSEHLGFGISYLIAAAATISIISTYLCSVLKGPGRGALFGGILCMLYAALYGLLQSEDLALVAGSSLLFGLLGLVMMLTRNVDWYALGQKTKETK